MNLNVNKKEKNSSSHSMVFGRWPQTKFQDTLTKMEKELIFFFLKKRNLFLSLRVTFVAEAAADKNLQNWIFRVMLLRQQTECA